MTKLTRASGLRRTGVVRLALLVTGLLAAQTCVIAQIGAELLALRLTQATSADSVTRRLRRVLTDTRLTARTCYTPLLHQVVDWSAMKSGRDVLIAVDESSKTDQVHLVRFSLTCRGGSIPLVWAIWAQNEKLPEGRYWHVMDQLLDDLAAVLPYGVRVVIVGDRAYGVPNLIDRLHARRWRWLFRLKTRDSHRLRNGAGQEFLLRDLVSQRLPGPGRRWKQRAWLFKGAGWREVNIVGVWAHGHDDPLVVVTNLPGRWETLRQYERRFWIEPGFRNDKTKGWRWEECQVRELAQYEVLLVAMAWASLLVVCIGLEEADRRLAEAAAKPYRGERPPKPQPARESLFTMGLRKLRDWFYRTTDAPLPWRLTVTVDRSWNDCWRGQQSYRFVFAQTVRS